MEESVTILRRGIWLFLAGMNLLLMQVKASYRRVVEQIICDYRSVIRRAEYQTGGFSFKLKLAFWEILKGARNLSKKEKHLVLHGFLVFFVIIPMISAVYLTAAAQAKTMSESPVGLRVPGASTVSVAKRQNRALPSRSFLLSKRKPSSSPPPAKIEPKPEQPPPQQVPPMLTQNTQNLNPELLHRFDAFRSFIYLRYKVVLEIRSGWRSTEEQAQLYNSLPRGYANPPGTSNHERGEAIDYTPYSAEYNKYLRMFGLYNPYPGHENWHIERVELH
jgi:hypothetical protein